MFRRRSSTAEQDSPAAEPAAEATAASPAAPGGGKGRPTPKRREAERNRRTYVQAPKTRKEAAQKLRERQGDPRQTQMRALRSGDESNLPARDAGPVKKLVRNVVDSRRGFGGYFLFLTLGLLVLNVLLTVAVGQRVLTQAASLQLQQYLMFAWYAVVVLVVIDSIFLTRRIRTYLRERLPDESHGGITMYAVMRSLQIRRLRLPPPKVKPGDEI